MASGRFKVVKDKANLEIELTDDSFNSCVKTNSTELVANPADEKEKELLSEVVKALNADSGRVPITLDRVVKKLIKIGFSVFPV